MDNRQPQKKRMEHRKRGRKRALVADVAPLLLQFNASFLTMKGLMAQLEHLRRRLSSRKGSNVEASTGGGELAQRKPSRKREGDDNAKLASVRVQALPTWQPHNVLNRPFQTANGRKRLRRKAFHTLFSPRPFPAWDRACMLKIPPSFLEWNFWQWLHLLAGSVAGWTVRTPSSLRPPRPKTGR